MYQRDHQRRPGPSHAGQARRAAHPVVALQRLIGNRGTTRVLARDKKKNAANFARSVQFGKWGPVEVKVGTGNVDEWLGTASPDNLDLTTFKGKHSEELAQLSGSKTRIDKLVLSAVSGENTMVTITLSHVLVKDYAEDGKTESWR